MSTDVQSNITA